MPLTQLQQRVASLVTGLPEAEGFVLAGGAAMAAHGVLDRTTRDLDYFGGPEQAAAVHRLAAAVERECIAVAAEKDPGLDLAVLDEFMARVHRLPRDEFPVDDDRYTALLRTVEVWRARLGRQIDRGSDTPEA